uniref:Protein kinase domain-containing protein n=1 Tax=Panagrellus redivivus TaxID=6233 RepID=A0A7E4V035_PANRE
MSGNKENVLPKHNNGLSVDELLDQAVADQPKAPAPMKASFQPRLKPRVEIYYNRKAGRLSREFLPADRTAIFTNVHGFLDNVLCLQKTAVALRLPTEFTHFKKKMIRFTADKNIYYHHVQLENDTENGFQMNLLMKEVVIGDVAFSTNDKTCKAKSQARIKLNNLALDLYIAHFLKHENILPAVLCTTDVNLMRYKVFYQPHTPMRVIRNEIQRMFPKQNNILYESGIPIYVIKEAAKGLKFLRDCRVKYVDFNLNTIYASPEGRIRVGDFDKSSVLMMYDKDYDINKLEDEDEPDPYTKRIMPYRTCEGLGLAYLDLIMPRYVDGFIQFEPSVKEVRMFANTITEPPNRLCAGIVNEIHPVDRDFINKCCSEYHIDTIFQESILRENIPDKSVELAVVMKELDIYQLPETFVDHPNPPSLKTNNLQPEFLARNPVIQFTWEFTDTILGKTDRASLNVYPSHPRILLQSLTKIFGRASDATNTDWMYQPGDFIPISFNIHQMLFEIMQMVMWDRRPRVPFNAYQMQRDIQLGHNGTRLMKLIARVSQCSGVEIEGPPMQKR